MKRFIIRMSLIIGHSSFRIKDQWYRTTGFFYIHVFPGGEKLMSGVSKFRATHVSGYGVSGTIVPFTDIEEIRYSYRPFHRKHDMKGWKRLSVEKVQYRDIKGIPEDMTKDDWDNEWIDRILDRATPGCSGNKYLWWFDHNIGVFLMKPWKYDRYMENTYGPNYHTKPKVWKR